MKKSRLWDQLENSDEVSLVQQLLEVYGEETEDGTLVLIDNPVAEKYVQLSPDVCGFRNEKTLEAFELNKVLFQVDSKTYPYFDKMIGSNVYKASIDWKALREYAGRLHDSEADRPYGRFKQKSLLIKALFNEADEQSSKELTVTEKILGKYYDHIAIAQDIRGDDSPDRFVRFVETLKLLQNEGFLKILRIRFNFDALPRCVESEEKRLEKGVFIDDDAYFYSAEHCSVTIKLNKLSPREKLLKKQKSQEAIRPSNLTEETVEHLTDSALERSFEEEIKLISKLLQICNSSTKSVELIRPARIADSDPDRAGFDKIETLKDLSEQYNVLSDFDPSLDVLSKSVTGIVKAKIDYAKLKERAGNLHDEVESWKGKVYGIEQQKQFIFSRLMDYINKSPHENDNLYEYSERILGTYTPVSDVYPLGMSLSRPDLNRVDIKYQFMRAMRELEKDGKIKIVDVRYEFDAQPRATSASAEASKWSLGERSLEFYPARHCHVKFQLLQSDSILNSAMVPLPHDVVWSCDEDKYTLTFNDGKVLKFIDLSKPTAKYFKLLIENHGCEIKHKKVMEEYVKGITKTQIENCVKALRKKIKNAGLSSRIIFETVFEGGYKLVVKPLQ